ncbi:Hypothetical predicted protein [Mytilus galloprovincialis]|uniref:Uncharacterized protein n=1 Tax=Mytilus galloprovincialis TaxID=29158 RepID=A0A8B6FQB6_MYTGA|nr:Hypothetical predicted protein [Mytilus galloprovincialis]
MIGAICSAVYYYNHTYYFFDTHSHSECALNNPLDSSGKSILIGFADLHDLLSYLYGFYTSLQIDLDSQFEILPVCISSKDTDKDVTKQIKNYFEDQKLRNTKQKKVSYQYMKVPKFVYMKNYMQKRRKNKQFKEKELNAKRYSRKDKNYRKTEAHRKKSQRDNSDIRQMERQRELAAKREARKDENYRRAEAEKEARKDENYRRAEAESKKSQRDNPDLRRMERQREFVAKREARKNEDFKKTELAAKREVRKDKNYRRAEAESKKSQRDNPD